MSDNRDPELPDLSDNPFLLGRKDSKEEDSKESRDDPGSREEDAGSMTIVSPSLIDERVIEENNPDYLNVSPTIEPLGRSILVDNSNSSSSSSGLRSNSTPNGDTSSGVTPETGVTTPGNTAVIRRAIRRNRDIRVPPAVQRRLRNQRILNLCRRYCNVSMLLKAYIFVHSILATWALIEVLKFDTGKCVDVDVVHIDPVVDKHSALTDVENDQKNPSITNGTKDRSTNLSGDGKTNLSGDGKTNLSGDGKTNLIIVDHRLVSRKSSDDLGDFDDRYYVDHKEETLGKEIENISDENLAILIDNLHKIEAKHDISLLHVEHKPNRSQHLVTFEEYQNGIDMVTSQVNETVHFNKSNSTDDDRLIDGLEDGVITVTKKNRCAINALPPKFCKNTFQRESKEDDHFCDLVAKHFAYDINAFHVLMLVGSISLAQTFAGVCGDHKKYVLVGAILHSLLMGLGSVCAWVMFLLLYSQYVGWTIYEVDELKALIPFDFLHVYLLFLWVECVMPTVSFFACGLFTLFCAPCAPCVFVILRDRIVPVSVSPRPANTNIMGPNRRTVPEFVVEATMSRCELQTVTDHDTLNSNSSCVICMSEWAADEEMATVPACSHHFHKDCLEKWIRFGGRSCPVCRSVFEPLSDEEMQV